MTNNSLEPDWLSSPGESILDAMDRYELSEAELARALGESVSHLNRVISGSAPITPALADKLSQALGGSPSFWLVREQNYRNEVDRLQEKGSADAAAAWLRELPVRSMEKAGWINPDSRKDREAALLAFFGVSSAKEWRKTYGGLISAAAFRTSMKFRSSPGAVVAWLRYGQLLAEKIQSAPWSPAKLRQAIPMIRSLTRIKNPAFFVPKLREILAAAGVAFVFAQTPEGCSASGATYSSRDGKRIVLLSFRYLSDDQFWFTLLHEVAHLLLHGDAIFLEGSDDLGLEEETAANEFAANVLIPTIRREEFYRLEQTKDAVLRFAASLAIAPGLVVGQLQHAGVLPRSKLNYLKRHYTRELLQAVT
jgi:addiction module HigA family antidote